MKMIVNKITTFGKVRQGSLFICGDTLALKSEYATIKATNERQEDAYIVGSGEYFWGGASTVKDRDELKVVEVEIKF